MNPDIPGPILKPSRTARKIGTHKTKLARVKHEKDEKGDVRKRDKFCRFPQCGCRRLKLALQVAHGVQHKGAGGNPDGSRSLAKTMIYLCGHRHQHAPRVSLHKGGLKPKFLTRQLFDGPIAWLINMGAGLGGWREVARESAVQRWEPFTPWQEATLKRLAEMEQ